MENDSYDPEQAQQGAPQTPPAPSGGTNPWDDSIKQAYKQYTGRTPGAQEVMTHYGNPGGLNGVLDTIKNSDEAKAFSQGQMTPEARAAAVGQMSDVAK